ncbi:MAG: HAD-IA family hydrolase [Deltaproteobacteria bacterium]|nr:HAD-IA family hydrolase [Deltaproteobacteria bacterium]
MKSVDLMVFDFDGTLVKSGGDIAASVNHALEMLGVPRKTPATIMRFIGDGVQKLIASSLGPEFGHCFHEAMEIFTIHYTEHMLDTTTLYESVIEVLRHFHEKKKIIVTNKRKSFTIKMADAFGITEHFEEIIGADSTPYKKPDPRLLHPVLERYRATPDRTIVIGDGVNDILLARHTGVFNCALLNGLTDRDVLLSLKPDFYCEDISELKNLFR